LQLSYWCKTYRLPDKQTEKTRDDDARNSWKVENIKIGQGWNIVEMEETYYERHQIESRGVCDSIRILWKGPTSDNISNFPQYLDVSDQREDTAESITSRARPHLMTMRWSGHEVRRKPCQLSPQKGRKQGRFNPVTTEVRKDRNSLCSFTRFQSISFQCQGTCG